jgi:hypothetical protein
VYTIIAKIPKPNPTQRAKLFMVFISIFFGYTQGDEYNSIKNQPAKTCIYAIMPFGMSFSTVRPSPLIGRASTKQYMERIGEEVALYDLIRSTAF